MTKATFAPEAEADLIEIGGFIALDSDHHARAFVQKLREKALQIARKPRICRPREDLAPGLRSAVIGKYLILFRIVDDGIVVLHVVHGARDLPSFFRKSR